jgi:DNA-binding MarR family transcriptional regulator
LPPRNKNRLFFVIWRGRDVEEYVTMTDRALTGWMRTLVSYVRSGRPDLTNRQMALLMLVYLTSGPHTVRGLAATLGVSKPVVTRALNTLGALGYLRRERDLDDRRNIFVVRTEDGTEFLDSFRSFLPGADEPFVRLANDAERGEPRPRPREPAYAAR